MSEYTARIYTTQAAHEWDKLINRLDIEQRDVFLLSGYARIFEKVYGASCGLFFYGDEENFFLQHFLARPVKVLPFAHSLELKEQLYDIISPEYAGPLRKGIFNEGVLLDHALEAFHRYCTDNRIVAEFGRLNPYYNSDSIVRDKVHACLNRNLIALDLQPDETVIYRGYSKGNRSSIKKAMREGIVVKRIDCENNLDDFVRIYFETMKRNHAAAFYYFSQEFFRDLCVNLREHVSLFAAFYKDSIVAASLFLHLGDYIHYYFSGSNSEFLKYCPNNLLLHEAILWAKSEGFKTFNLGGGYHNSGKDTLFAFKQSFSQKITPFYVYRRIHDEVMYKTLCDAYCGFNKITEISLNNENDYFPFYRK